MPHYPKDKVLDAAHTAGEETRAERARLCAIWDARNWLYKAVQSVMFFGDYRPESHGFRAEETANRLIFKASNCVEDYLTLSDHEIDVISPYWKN